MPVSKRTRYEVLRRDNYTCRYCRSTENELTVDHVTPSALGGTDEPGNLVAACRDCNAGKTSTTPDAALVDDVTAVDIKWADALRRAAVILEQQHDAQASYIERWGDEWAAHTWNSAPRDAEQSVARLFVAGLPVEVMAEAVRATGSAWGVQNRFAYFMGICWKRVAAMQETARQLLEVED